MVRKRMTKPVNNTCPNSSGPKIARFLHLNVYPLAQGSQQRIEIGFAKHIHQHGPEPNTGAVTSTAPGMTTATTKATTPQAKKNEKTNLTILSVATRRATASPIIAAPERMLTEAISRS